jgi:hypothetical protein
LYKIPPGLSGLSGDIWTTMSRAYNTTRFTIPFDISVGEFCVSDCVAASKIGLSLTKSERRNRQMVATTTKLIIFIWIKIDNEYWKVRSKSFHRQLWIIFGCDKTEELPFPISKICVIIDAGKQDVFMISDHELLMPRSWSH